MKNMDWWEQGRFGMFIHFGIYAVTEGAWEGEVVPTLVEWMQFRKQIPLERYKQLAEGLTLEKFDAREYARLAKAAGMKYVCITAKHHDGFAMYDSTYSDYNVVKMTPSHRDVVRELAEEVRRAGLKMCVYYSHALDWEDPDAFGNTWDYPEAGKVFRQFLDGKCKAQLKELLTEYGEIGMVWFDMPRGMTVEESREIRAWVEKFQPDCLVSGRIHMDQTVGDYGCMGDNEFPSGRLPGRWETPATLNNKWGYSAYDQNWKSPEELLRLLIELLSKGMNYLLNIGPKPDGSIPKESVEILEEMGKWVSRNAEAVYGTQATPYDFDFPWGRISRKGNRLYLYLFEHMDNLALPGLENEVKNAYLIQENGKVEVPFTITEEDNGKLVQLRIPSSTNPCYDVIGVELDGEPGVKQGLFELPDGQVSLFSHMAALHKLTDGGHESSLEGQEASAAAEKNNILLDTEFCVDPNGNILNWFDTENFVSWNFEMNHTGIYEVYVQTRSAKYQPWVGGHEAEAICGAQRITSVLACGEKVTNAHSRYFDEKLSLLGRLELQKGRNHLELHLCKCNPEEKAGFLVTRVLLKRTVKEQ